MTATPDPTVHDLLVEVTHRLNQHRDPVAARQMQAYMKNHFAFLGIRRPAAQRLYRDAGVRLTDPSETQLIRLVRSAYGLSEREFHYFGVWYARRHERIATDRFIPTLKFLIVTHSWWDTVDEIAAHVVGPLAARSAKLRRLQDEWVISDNLWLRRTALLHQLQYKERTDVDRLFRYCELRAEDSDFFIRKAIGWALRQYARVDPRTIRAFVRAHRSTLSPLSIREATRHL